jgi:hypothetical protein
LAQPPRQQQNFGLTIAIAECHDSPASTDGA